MVWVQQMLLVSWDEVFHLGNDQPMHICQMLKISQTTIMNCNGETRGVSKLPKQKNLNSIYMLTSGSTNYLIELMYFNSGNFQCDHLFKCLQPIS